MNSLFKVLFNFPSRYLFSIGLATVFSLRWSLPPSLGCILKQPDSGKTQSGSGARPYRPDTRCGMRPRSEGRRRTPTAAQRLPYVTTRHAQKTCRFDAGLVPIHSPLLRESLLVSFPPLNNMLKFSGCSRLNSGRNDTFPSSLGLCRPAHPAATRFSRSLENGPTCRARGDSHAECPTHKDISTDGIPKYAGRPHDSLSIAFRQSTLRQTRPRD